MKLLKTLTLIAAFGLSISLTTHAATRTDVWSGNAALTNTAGVQPDFTSAAGGILYSDADVLGGANNSTDHQGATLWAGPLGPNYPYGLHEAYLYTFFATPAMTVTSNGVLEDVGYIYLTITGSASNFAGNSVTLGFDGSFDLVQFSQKALGPTPTPIGDQDLFEATWAWEVNGNVDPADFTLSWTTPAAHIAYFDINLTQSVEAIPEPSTWALLGAGLVAAVWMSRRRKASLSVGQ